MDVLARYNSALQVAAAFLIFIIAYLALLLVIVVCLLAAEAVHQSVAFARTSLSKTMADHKEPSLPIAETVNRSSAFGGWTHRLSHSLAGSLKFR
jgi:ABC-type transport system involved in cytochrome bd biosynthesis fused ATPase/permease subunit